MALKTSNTIGEVFAGKQAFTNSQKATQMLGRSIIGKLNRKQITLTVDTKELDRTQKKIQLLDRSLNKLEKRKVKISTAEAAQKDSKSNLMSKLAIGKTIIAPIKLSADFEQSIANIGAVSNASKEELNNLTAKARELGASTRWSASQAANGMKLLADKGFSANQTIAAMPSMLNLASAGSVNLASAANITSDILSSFGKDAEYMGTLGDILTNTFTSSDVSMSSLGEAMKRAAPAAASVGMEINTLAAMTGKLGDSGIQGSAAGSSLSAVVNSLSTPKKEAKKTLSKLGIETIDADGNLRDVPTVLAEIDQAMSGMGSGVKRNLLSTIFGMKDANAAEILMTHASSGALQEYEKKLLEQGSTQSIVDKQNATTIGETLKLNSAVESLSLTIGNVLLPSVASMAGFLAVGISWIGNLAEKFPTATTAVVGLTVGIGGVSIALSALGYATSSIQLGLLKLGQTFTMVSTGVKWLSAKLKLGALAQKAYALASTVLTGTLRILGGALRLTAASVLWVSKALMMNPIGQAITAIGFAAFVIYKYWEPISNFFSGLWTEIKTAFDGGLAGIGALIVNWSPLGLFYKAFSSLMEWFGVDMPENFSEFGSTMIDNFIGGILSGLSKVGKLLDTVKGWFGFDDESKSYITVDESQLDQVGKNSNIKIGTSIDKKQHHSTYTQYASGYAVAKQTQTKQSSLAYPQYASGYAVAKQTQTKRALINYRQPSQQVISQAYGATRPQQNNQIHVTVNNPNSTVDVEQAVTKAMADQTSGVPLTDKVY